jgi:hypothetical protein
MDPNEEAKKLLNEEPIEYYKCVCSYCDGVIFSSSSREEAERLFAEAVGKCPHCRQLGDRELLDPTDGVIGIR